MDSRIYELGKLMGSILPKVQESVDDDRKDIGETVKVYYKSTMECLAEMLLILEDTKISPPTENDISDELERLVEIYGELKYDKTLPKGQRILGGIKQKFQLLKQSRKTLKDTDKEILLDKLKIWDDRFKIGLA